MKIDVLTDVAPLEPEWDALLAATSCNRAFSSFAWFQAASAEGGSPLVVTARLQGRLVAILPLFVPDGSSEARFATRLADYNDVIATERVEAALLDAALDVTPSLLLRELRHDSALYGAVSRMPNLEHEPARPVIWTSLTGGWEGWLAERSRAFRKGLFRAQRAAAEGGLVVRELETADDFLALHDARPRESVFAEEEHRAFIRRALPVLLAQKRMRAFGVLDGDRVVAIDLCAAGAASLCTWNTGFLPGYAGYSPGTLLLAEEIRTACTESIPELDLGRGDEPYKLSWATQRRVLARVRLRR